MIALILGGAPSVWQDLAEAQALLNRRHLIVAANHAGIAAPGKLDGWCSLHPEGLPKWRSERKGPPAARYFVPAGEHTIPGAEKVADRWNTSSGGYAMQCALMEMGATAAILCGIPMDALAGHFTGRTLWESPTSYRLGFAAALPLIGGRVRSMSGWTEQLFGRPTPEWAGAVENIKPIGAKAPPTDRIRLMHNVKNTSSTTQKFWAPSPDGQRKLIRLAPGEALDIEIDPAQPRFAKGGPFHVTAARKPQAADIAPKSKD